MKKILFLSLVAVFCASSAVLAQSTSCGAKSQAKSQCCEKGDAGCCKDKAAVTQATVNQANEAPASLPLSVRFAKLQEGAEKGCAQSQTKLASFQKECGSGCSKSISSRIASLEKSAAQGCEKSQGKLAAMTAMLNGKKAAPANIAMPLSVRFAKLQEGAEKGCAQSQTKLATFQKECGSGCSKSIADKIATLEKCAAQGCEKSQVKLAAMEAQFDQKQCQEKKSTIQ